MRFEDAYEGWTEKRLTQEEAARLLGVCPRTFRRYINRYEEDGLNGLIDKRLARVSHRRALVDEVMRLVDRYRNRHQGWNVKHYTAWYKREGGPLLEPGHVHPLRVEDKPVVLSEFVPDRRGQRPVAWDDFLGSSLDLKRGEGAVRPTDHGVYRIVVHERQVDVEPLLEHLADDPILDSFAEACAVTEGKRHRSAPRANRATL